jgi:hypothetical protein
MRIIGSKMKLVRYASSKGKKFEIIVREYDEAGKTLYAIQEAEGNKITSEGVGLTKERVDEQFDRAVLDGSMFYSVNYIEKDVVNGRFAK